MRQVVKCTLVVACFATLFLTCYGPALFGDRQFGYRDAAHYYYPLHQRVQAEWNAGRWPLWEQEENAGMPLLGNPTAAVLYPGKLIFAILPYARAARVYIVIHTALAFVAMLVLMRSWRASWVGSTLSALGYSFGVPILFQHSNVIYLVGAAWLPLGFRAADRWVRLGRRWGLIELAIVLAMQTLGGDLESAYLLGWAAGGYAAGIAWSRRDFGLGWHPRSGSSIQNPKSEIRNRKLLWTAIGLSAWVVGTIVLARWLPMVRPPGRGGRPFPWTAWVPLGVTAAWGLATAAFLLHWMRRGRRFPLGRTWLGLVVSAGLATAVTAAQLLPVIEFSRQTIRAAADGPHDLYLFSLEPLRLVELAWPGVLGVSFGGNTDWRDILNIPGCRREIWMPSLYLGGLTLVLAGGAWAVRQGPPWRIWLSVIVVFGLVGSLGQYASPVWAARFAIQATRSQRLQDLVGHIGPHDPVYVAPIRLDGFLRDGDGGIYWWLATILPGFRQFRFPAKLFTFTALGLAALAGMGWDGLRDGGARRASRLFAMLLVVSLAVLAAVWIERAAILTAFRSTVVASVFGPFDAGGGFRAILRSLVQASIVSGLGLVAVRHVRTRPHRAGMLVLMVMTADLAVANARYVVTVPQSVLESKPEVLRAIEDEERRLSSSGPFRVYRMAAWEPRVWQTTASPDRPRDFVAWERDTLEPKYGINLGIEYTHAFGVGGLLDHEWFFGDFPVTIDTPEAARVLGVRPGQKVVYYPRRSFDIWNTRYFIIPSDPHGWQEEYRGYASFLFRSETIYPQPPTGRESDLATAAREWVENRDFQVKRNLDALPRAWVVHGARWLDPVAARPRNARTVTIEEILYANDPLWHDPRREVFDPRDVAWVDRDQRPELEPYLSGRPPRPSETVMVSYPTPQRTELEATLESPGLVILSDVHYPGWELTIDGESAPIYRVNRMMRGAAVPAGTHHLVYSYIPRSFRLGCVVSIAGLGVLALLGVAFIRWPVDRLRRGGEDLE